VTRLLPSLINLTFGRRRFGCTNIPLAADRAWDDEAILAVRQSAMRIFGSPTRIRQD
jgi:hypothetical protein